MDTAAVTTIPDVVNSATRTERAADAVPATVTVTPAAQAEARAARDLKDWFRYEVDVTVRAATPRFSAALASTGRAGNEGLNVRGLEGNQVLLMVDGIRVPQAFSFGAFAVGRGDYLFLEATAAAEVLRGPASTSFGSDGLAGAVQFRSLEAADILRSGQKQGGFARLGGNGIDDSTWLTAAYAWRDAGSEALILASTRQGASTRNQGRDESPDARRTAPNPTDYRQQGVLAKYGWALTPTQRLGLTLEAVTRRTETEVLSGRTTPPMPPAVLPATAVIDLDGRDRIERQRASVKWTLEDPNAKFVQSAQAQIYTQQARNRQYTYEDRNTAVDRIREGTYRERITGLSAQAQHSTTEPFAQRISAGLDLSQADIRALRDGTVPPTGESFPSKPFPDTRYRLFGAFVQSEIEAGALTVIPALRFDHYELDPSPSGFIGTVKALSDQAFTPRLGVIWRASAQLAPYVQWAKGFRAPTPDQVNNGFSNPTSFYESIGNPNLRPERAQSIEAGVRLQIAPKARLKLALFDNRYRDFISQQQVRGSFRVGDPAVFQYINLDDARIRGAEARIDWTPLEGLRVRAAYASHRGDSIRAGVRTPLLTIEPARAWLGAQWTVGAFEWRADVLHVRGKATDRIPAANPPAFAPPGYTVVDVGLSWRATREWTLHAGIDNLLDKTYWRWSDVRGLSSTSTVRDAFTAPPRSFSLVLRRDF
ncbi:MAG: TonB-dependent hemoglobin/transferrin/lactoferrin family receptor [Burkholderiaceae bacterium]|nr:TonB-dependent hemoglobin/transferrin/lactoferrin family receptor [Burkholderiaceae bacterium]